MAATNDTTMTAMPLKIGVMGGAGGNLPQDYLDKALRLGEAIADELCVMITGACPGLPEVAPICRTLQVLNFGGYIEAQRSVRWRENRLAGMAVRGGDTVRT